jgi:HEPN domain-containing protein
MVNEELSCSYLRRASVRFEILREFFKRGDYADVIREAQEAIELLQKAMLIYKGIEPPKWHDVSDIIIDNLTRFNEELREKLSELRPGSKWLRSQRELSFYGDMDFIPERVYTDSDAKMAIEIVEKHVEIAHKIIER